MTQIRRQHQQGFTLVELIVSLSLFSIIGLSMTSFLTSVIRTASIEGMASRASQELWSGLQLMSAELRMSSAVSPYIVGNVASTVTCSSAFALTSTTIRFLIVQDEATATTSGIQPYYVGYSYDATTKQLLRGEISGTSITGCTPPSGDPTSSTTATVLAENVVPIDGDGNGTVDAAFTTSGNSVLVNLGIQVDGPNSTTITQAMPLSIYRRTV